VGRVMILPGLRNIEAAKQLYERLNGWKLANEVISSYFQNHRDNTKEQSVVTKVVLVNSLYFTNIREPLRMARHILELHELDAQLMAGEVEAVERIAQADRYYISFASKYAHFHNKTAFPIFDSFAVAAMSQLQERGRRSFPSYIKFFETIKAFREQAGLTSVSWEDFDKYLWLYGQKKALDKGNRTINKEVSALYDSPEGHALFEGLEP
ncbi:unnamed protein product, partial [marine sediment metagenome]